MKLSDKVHTIIKERVSAGILICGNVLLSGEHGFVALPGIDPEKLSKGISEVIDKIRACEKIHRKVNVILIEDLYAGEKCYESVFNSAGFCGYSAGPNMVVPVRNCWQSFNDTGLKKSTSEERQLI